MRAFAFLAVLFMAAAAFGQGVFHPASQVAPGIFGSELGGGNFTFNNSMFVVDKLGIGTTSPGDKLEVSGGATAYSVGAISVTGGDQTGAITPIGRIYAYYTSAGWDKRQMRFAVGQTGAIGVADAMTINAGGNVGIGTTSLAGNYKLRVRQDYTSVDTGIMLQDPNGETLSIWSNTGGGAGIYTKTSTPLFFGSNNAATRMIINTAGNVGINTTTPGATLEVKGTMKIFGAWESKSNDAVYQATTDGFVVDYGGYSPVNSGGSATGYTDGSNPPTTIRAFSSVFYSSVPAITMPVRKGDYWKVVNSHGGGAVWWIPLGT